MLHPQKVYRDLVNESTGGPRHVITVPRDLNQVANFRKEVSRKFRISHDSMFNIYQLCFQLFTTNSKGESVDFITSFCVYPNILVHMIHQPLMDVLAKLLRLSTSPVCFHYDTVFNIGDFYLSTLSFRHSMFKQNPVVPFAYFVHSRKFHEDHINFLTSIRKRVPLLATKSIIVVTDQEFHLGDLFPSGYHVFCWNHMERDLHYYLKSKANCTATEISYFANAFKQLMNEPLEEDFDSLWNVIRKSSHFTRHSVVLNYFEKRLIPTFKVHSSIWVLKSAGCPNPHNGITNNASESINAVLHSLQNWKQVPLDVVCVSLFHLCSYYNREIIRGIHRCGSLEIADEYAYYQRDPTLMPSMTKAIDPKEIVERARGNCLQFNTNTSDKSEQDDPDVTTSTKSEEHTQIGLAIDAVKKKYVSLVDTGTWIVKSADGSKPYLVTLFPKENCSCASKKVCYHVMACRLMLGQSIEQIEKPNLTLLQQQNRRKNKEKPSGRKRPRKNDTDPDPDSLGE